MQNMIPVTINLAEMPEDERRVLSAEAVRRGVPFEVVVREAMAAWGRELARAARTPGQSA